MKFIEFKLKIIHGFQIIANKITRHFYAHKKYKNGQALKFALSTNFF